MVGKAAAKQEDKERSEEREKEDSLAIFNENINNIDRLYIYEKRNDFLRTDYSRIENAARLLLLPLLLEIEMEIDMDTTLLFILQP